MSRVTKPPPLRFEKNGGAVTMAAPAYITLLVSANITDPKMWPPGMRHGAKGLARIRAIESRCIAKHGEFDWEKLSPKLQDEYDSLCLDLDKLQSTGEWIEWEEYKARRRRGSR